MPLLYLSVSYSLEILYLKNNKLNGTLPSELGLLSSLRTLSLYNNQIHGTIPSQFGFLTSITELGLSNNSLSGTIPVQALGQLTQLRQLYLSHNPLLNGTLPELELLQSNWSNVVDLDVLNGTLVTLVDRNTTVNTTETFTNGILR